MNGPNDVPSALDMGGEMTQFHILGDQKNESNIGDGKKAIRGPRGASLWNKVKIDNLLGK